MAGVSVGGLVAALSGAGYDNKEILDAMGQTLFEGLCPAIIHDICKLLKVDISIKIYQDIHPELPYLEELDCATIAIQDIQKYGGYCLENDSLTLKCDKYRCVQEKPSGNINFVRRDACYIKQHGVVDSNILDYTHFRVTIGCTYKIISKCKRSRHDFKLDGQRCSNMVLEKIKVRNVWIWVPIYSPFNYKDKNSQLTNNINKVVSGQCSICGSIFKHNDLCAPISHRYVHEYVQCCKACINNCYPKAEVYYHDKKLILKRNIWETKCINPDCQETINKYNVYYPPK